MEKSWLCEYKINGYEILDFRIGGIKTRVKSAKRRLDGYLAGALDSLPEVEEEKLFFHPQCSEEEKVFSYNIWSHIFSAAKLQW